MTVKSHMAAYLAEAAEIAGSVDQPVIEEMIQRLLQLKTAGGRLFLCGVGGSAGNCSHAVNDFRKLTGIEAYAPTDNVSELTARTNDEGWETVFSEWLKVSRAGSTDVLMIFSVGGGSAERNISMNLVRAIDEAKRVGMDVLGIVGRDGGYTRKMGDIVVVIPTVNPNSVTPHTEAFQAVLWHGIVSDPRLMSRGNKWETTVQTIAKTPAR